MCVCMFVSVHDCWPERYIFFQKSAINLKILGARTDYMKLVPNRGPHAFRHRVKFGLMSDLAPEIYAPTTTAVASRCHDVTFGSQDG